LSTTITPFLVHLGYGLMLCAFLARDVLWLRALLAGAQSLLVVYALLAGLTSVAAWNGLFASVNALWAVTIVRERRQVTLPPDLAATYARHFAALAPPEFLRLWEQGRREIVRDRALTRDAEYPDALYFLMTGTARVSRQGRLVRELGAGHFVAEMSLLTGEPANADVDAIGEVEAVRWAIRDLRSIQQRNPVLWTKIQSVIGQDMVRKIQTSSTSEGRS
jgi:hypothetical protein